MKKKYYYLGIIVLTVIFVTGISIVFAQSWQPPAGPPPGNNAQPPINTASDSQTKGGPLWANPLGSVGGLHVNGTVEFPGLIESLTNTRILTAINNPGFPDHGELRWREAGSWAGGGGGGTVAGYERVQGPSTSYGTPSVANCTAGKKVIGGGCGPGASGQPLGEFVGYGYPNSDTSYSCHNNYSDVRAWAICVSGL
jgi:hypothetical protein